MWLTTFRLVAMAGTGACHYVGTGVCHYAGTEVWQIQPFSGRGNPLWLTFVRLIHMAGTEACHYKRIVFTRIIAGLKNAIRPTLAWGLAATKNTNRRSPLDINSSIPKSCLLLLMGLWVGCLF